jgi:catechol 2,3-dioxygenase-like lactoylglutathione lyase family enzyme
MLKALHHVNLIVSDMEKTKAFYNGILGLPIALETVIEDAEFSRGVGLPDTKVIATFFQLPNNAGLIETFQYARPANGKPLPTDKKANDAGWTHICFLVEDIEKEVKELEGKGISFLSTPVTIAKTHPVFAGVRFCYFLGPDREVIEILQG